MEIIIIVLLLASLFGVWIVSVRRKLELREENIRNAMHQTLVQLSAERGGSGRIGGVSRTDHGCGDFSKNETYFGECTECRNDRDAGVDNRATERIIESTEKYCRDLGNHASFAGAGDLSEILESSKKL